MVLSVGLLAIAGCRSSDPTEPPPFPAPPSVTGEWMYSGQNLFSIDLTLTQYRAHVTGDGMLTTPPNGQTYEADISGSCAYPQVTITIAIPGYESILLTGTLVDSSMITGVLNQSGFTDFPVQFMKVHPS